MLLGLFVQTLKAGDTAANGSAPNTSACFGDLMAVHGDITSFRFLSTTVVDQTMLDAFNNDERVQFEINGATFADGYELTRDDGHWIYGFWRKSVVQTDNFVTTAWPSGAVYDKMLWVIEHSYPAISMSTMMHDAGADYDRLYTEIAASQGGLSSAELDELVETIVYATIQEAVWHHQPAKVNDDPERFIGAKLIQGHQDTKLLYEYLTQERDEYTNYRSKVFGDSISIEHPADLTPAQNGAGYIYGPFSVSSDMLSAGTIELSIDAGGVNASVTDSAGTALSVVRAGQEYYVRTDARPSDALTLKAKTTDALTLTRSDRGRMYVHADAQQAAELQPVGTGGTPNWVSADDTLVLPAVAPPIIPGPTGERVSFKKIDADTQAPLDGAVIRIVDGNGATIFQGMTDNGVVSTDVELKYDTDYSYFEVTAPDGYELDETWHTLRLSSTGSNPEYWTLTNEKRPAPPPVTGEARIRKLGADTGAGLSGCKIEVRTASGAAVGQYTTGNDGYAVIAGLAPDAYTYREIQAPPCYLPDKNEYAFTVSETGKVTGTLSFSNARITTSVPIKKVDEKGNPLADATIVVLDTKQKQVFSGKTDASGLVTVNGLKAGESYTYYESSAPEGYLVNSTKYTFTVSDKGVVSRLMDIVNQAKGLPTPTPTPTPSPTPSLKPSATPNATPTSTPKPVIKPIPQTGVESGVLWYGLGALLLLSAAGYVGVRYYQTKKQRS